VDRVRAGAQERYPGGLLGFLTARRGLLLVYAIGRKDPVFIAGQALGLAIYSRNCWLIFRERRTLAAQQ
jgi:lipid-A-disaccharide synthase-like uncharacterized protein